MVPAWPGGDWLAGLRSSAAPPHHYAAALQFIDVLSSGAYKAPRATGGCATCCSFRCAPRCSCCWCSLLPIPLSGVQAAGANSKLLLVVVDDSFSMKAGSRFADAKQGGVAGAGIEAQIAACRGNGSGRQACRVDPAHSGCRSSAFRSGKYPAWRLAGESRRTGTRRARPGRDACASRSSSTSSATCRKPACRQTSPTWSCPRMYPLCCTRPATTAIPNWTVESVNAPAQLADPKDPKKSRVQAVIAGYGTPAASRTVSLVVNGNTIATRKVEIPADGRATVEFQPLDVPYGLNHCAITIDSADGFPADDISVFAVKRSDPERVLFVHPASDARSPALLWRRAWPRRTRRPSLCSRSIAKNPPTLILRNTRLWCFLTHCACPLSSRMLSCSTCAEAAAC